MNRKRIYSFDLIRAISALAIVLLHYNAIFLFSEPQRFDLMIFGTEFANIYLGAWAVSLFFIISGSSLMYVYGERKLNIARYCRKRITGIYPMFGLAYIFCFLFIFALNGNLPFPKIPKVNFIFTILGVDGGLSISYPTFYICGEGFLGCIILLYIIFPLFRFLINKTPKLSILIIAIIFIGTELFYKGPLPTDILPLTRLPEFCFGMYFVKYIKKVNLPTALISIVVIVANGIIKPDIVPSDIQIIYIGISSFLFFVYIAKFLEKNNLVRDLTRFFSKYSYAIFLTHHVIIYQVAAKLNVFSMSGYGSLATFMLCFVLTIIASYLLYKLEKNIMNHINTYLDNISNKLSNDDKEQ